MHIETEFRRCGICPFIRGNLSAGGHAMHADFSWAILANHGGLARCAQTIHGGEGITLPPPPAVEAIPVVDDYFGTKITDNYRWLEDAQSPATRALSPRRTPTRRSISSRRCIRPQVVSDLDALEKISETSPPLERANNYFFMRRWPSDSSPPSTCATAGREKTSAWSIRQAQQRPQHLSLHLSMSPATARCWPMTCAAAERTRPASIC